ncbi:hypothetical protein V8B97DRAFT_407694 [Scleroderma yunnanense]
MISSISTVLSKSLISCHLRYLSHCLTPSPSTSSSALRLPLPIRFFAFSYLSGPSSALSKIELQNRISISNHNHAWDCIVTGTSLSCQVHVHFEDIRSRDQQGIALSIHCSVDHWFLAKVFF